MIREEEVEEVDKEVKVDREVGKNGEAVEEESGVVGEEEEEDLIQVWEVGLEGWLLRSWKHKEGKTLFIQSTLSFGMHLHFVYYLLNGLSCCITLGRPRKVKFADSGGIVGET